MKLPVDLQLPRPLRAPRFDLHVRVRLSLVHARAFVLSNSVPHLFAFEILSPERPRPALHRPHRVDRAHGLALFTFQKNAVAVFILRQAVVKPHPPKVLRPQPSVLATKKFGDFSDFFLGGPDVPRLAAAAVSTLRAAERKPFAVPFLTHQLLIVPQSQSTIDNFP